MIKHILVGVTGRGTAPAKAECVFDLAERHDARVSLLFVVDVDRLSYVGPVPLGAGHYARQLADSRVRSARDAGESVIAPFLEAAAARGVPVDVIRAEGDPVAEFAARSRFHDLCVLGLKHWFDEDTVAQPDRTLGRLITSGVRPVIAVSARWRPVERVLIAFNGSVEAAKAMRQFAIYDAWPRVEAEVVCVGEAKTGEPTEAMLDQAVAYLELHGHRARGRQLARGASPADALLGHVEAGGFDMMVLGSSFRRLVTRERFGPNTLSAVRRASIPLFVSA